MSLYLDDATQHAHPAREVLVLYIVLADVPSEICTQEGGRLVTHTGFLRPWLVC
jgi:hypothetical protein